MPRKRPNLGRLRKSVARVNMIYGLLLQAHEQLRARVLELEAAAQADERTVASELEREEDELLALVA